MIDKTEKTVMIDRVEETNNQTGVMNWEMIGEMNGERCRSRTRR